MKGDSGWLNARLKNLRAAQKKLTNACSVRRSNTMSRASDANHQQTVKQKMVEDVIFLKSLPVSNENMNIFIEKLNSTRAHRMEMLMDKSIHLKEQFPYFFTNIELVIQALRNSMLKNIQLNQFLQILKEFELANPNTIASAFLDDWPRFSEQLRKVLIDHYKQKEVRTDWCSEIENVLVLLKMFPHRQVGRNVIASNPAFLKSIEKLIQKEPVIITSKCSTFF